MKINSKSETKTTVKLTLTDDEAAVLAAACTGFNWDQAGQVGKTAETLYHAIREHIGHELLSAAIEQVERASIEEVPF